VGIAEVVAPVVCGRTPAIPEARMIIDGFAHQLPDIDPHETEE